MAKTNYDTLPPLPRAGEAPMFRNFKDLNEVEISDNAHPEQEYEHHDRLLARFGDRKTGISAQVQGQVLRQEASRVGTMSYNSVLRAANPGGAGLKPENQRNGKSFEERE